MSILRLLLITSPSKTLWLQYYRVPKVRFNFDLTRTAVHDAWLSAVAIALAN